MQVPEKRYTGHMMPQKSFEVIANILAIKQLNEWTTEMDEALEQAMLKALNCDNRLSLKTREKIFKNFMEEMKKSTEERSKKVS